ncbi:MAG: hypothetical protein HY673_20685 [Chloroflexi bacterium]|nr:hypothetical protein [Chloroflexota bacterium]
MNLLLDADAMIKLYRGGVLGKLVAAFPCTVPLAVYDEVVNRGKARFHQDAEVIEEIISGTVTVASTTPEHRQPELGLGAGEIGILDLLAGWQDGLVVSDDRHFLTVLSMRGIPFLTPADMLVVLVRRGHLIGAEAREALERLRPAIRPAAYLETQQDLNYEGRNHEEE